MKYATIVAFVGTVLVGGSQTPATPLSPATPPRLIVLLVMDQFPVQYIERYGKQWTGGLRRLIDGGAFFTEARYPYAVTLTCAGHSTMGTGALPYVHGMMGNSFMDRRLGRTLPCMNDPDATSVPFGDGIGKEHHSPRAMRAPTFAQLLRAQAREQPQVVSVALKPRSAIGMVGRGGPGVTVVWEEDDGTWATSDAYTTKPWPDVDAFVRKHPLKQAYGDVWNRLKPESNYLFEDDGPGEARPTPWSRTFPHPLMSPKGVPDITFVSAWERSPWSDAYVADLAIELLRSRKLGTTSRTDMLAVSLPSLDLVAHEFGTFSHEAQDVLMRADLQVGKLLDAVERQVGRGRYVVAFSSDHGTATIPERLVAEGQDAGRISTTAIETTVNAAITKVLGEKAPYFLTVYEQEVVLANGVMSRLRQTPGGVEAVKSALAGVRGIAAAYSVGEITSAAPTNDPFIRAWRLSMVADRAGDFVFVPKLNWIVRSDSGSTHGSPHEYDQRVPLIFFGANVKPGQYKTTASPADIAPTFAWFTRVQLPQAQGRVLAEALSR